MFKALWRKKTLVVFLVALLVLFPAASVKPAQMLSKTLLVSIGIDKSEDGYEVSGIMVVNKFSQTGSEKLVVVSDKANSINTAINKIGANQGRKVSLAHCNLIVLGSGLKHENVASILTYFLMKYEMSNNALLVFAEDDPKKMQEISLENTTSATAGLLETIAAQAKDDFAPDSNLESFYKNYLRPSSNGILMMAGVKDDSLINPKTAAIFRDGKHKLTLDTAQTTAFGLLQRGKTAQSIVLDTDELHASLRVASKHHKIKTAFRNGIPVVHISCKPKLGIEEIVNERAPEQFIDIENALIASLKAAVDMQIGEDLAEVFSQAIQARVDILNLYDRFYREHNKAVKKYMENKTIDEFISAIEFTVLVNSAIVV